MSDKHTQYGMRKIVEPRHQLYILTGFEDEAEIKLRHKAIDESEIICVPIDPVTNIIGIIVKENHLNMLTDEEKSPDRLQKFPYPVIHTFYEPTIFRYMDTNFVDEFFNEGKLRLSSIRRFAKHDNDLMRDYLEGRLEIRVGDRHGLNVSMNVSYGHSAYILCFSLLENFDLGESMGFNSGFRVNNMGGFISEVSKAIKEVYKFDLFSVSKGPCVYVTDRIYENRSRTISSMKEIGIYDSSEGYENGFNFDEMTAFVRDEGKHALFYKLKSYATEHEYRIIWELHEENVPEYIDIVIPNAVKYCERIK